MFNYQFRKEEKQSATQLSWVALSLTSLYSLNRTENQTGRPLRRKNKLKTILFMSIQVRGVLKLINKAITLFLILLKKG